MICLGSVSGCTEADAGEVCAMIDDESRKIVGKNSLNIALEFTTDTRSHGEQPDDNKGTKECGKTREANLLDLLRDPSCPLSFHPAVLRDSVAPW